MKAIVKATGEIIEVSRHSGVMDDTNKRIYNRYEIETIDAHFTDNYWERLKHQYAGMAMQGLMSYVEQITPKEGRSFCDEIVGISFKVAHALVEKLKSESNGN